MKTFLAFLLIVLTTSPITALELTPFKIGISEAVNTVLPVWMAQAGGFYEARAPGLCPRATQRKTPLHDIAPSDFPHRTSGVPLISTIRRPNLVFVAL